MLSVFMLGVSMLSVTIWLRMLKSRGTLLIFERLIHFPDRSIFISIKKTQNRCERDLF